MQRQKKVRIGQLGRFQLPYINFTRNIGSENYRLGL